MRKITRSLFLLLTFVCGMIGAELALSQDLQRGLRNYQAVMSGKKTIEQLSPQEKQEVILVFQRVRALRYGNDKSQDCQDALDQAESNASDLADYSRRLRNCAEAKDFSDDCSSEYRRVKNAASDYEFAVSSVQSNCH
jgi:hypothetical protein